MAIVATPALRSAYAYAGSNPLSNIDPGGQEFTQAQRKAYIKANFARARELVAQNPALRASIEQNLNTRLPKSFVRMGLDIEAGDLRIKRAKQFDEIAKPFVEITISTGQIQLSPGLFKQFPIRKGASTPAAPNGKGAVPPVRKAPKPPSRAPQGGSAVKGSI